MASIIAIKLNLVPGGSPGGILPRVRVSQGDAEDRIIQFELFDGLAPADMSDVDQCYIGGVKPDGNGFTVSCTITSNVATAILTDQATVLAGEIRCKLYLLSATGSVRSAPFTLDVDPDPLADAGTSDTDITAIVQAAAMYANNASESAQEAAQAATGAASAGATAGQAAAEAVVNSKLDKSTAAEAWASGVEYVAGQYILYTDGHMYKCILDHTSSSSITPEDTTYWEDTTIADEITSCNSNYTNMNVKFKYVEIPDVTINQNQTYVLDISPYIPSGASMKFAYMWLDGYPLPYIDNGQTKTYIVQCSANKIYIHTTTPVWNNYTARALIGYN